MQADRARLRDPDPDGVALVLAVAAGVMAGTAMGPHPGRLLAATIAVDVVGRVQHPGLVRLPQGSRVLDAIEAAGGATAGAELEAVNLARKLVDGEQIRIPRHGEAVAVSPSAVGAGYGAAPGTPGQAGGTAAGQAGVPLDLNTATAEPVSYTHLTLPTMY